MRTSNNFCLAESGQLYPCPDEEWARQHHTALETAEPIPTPMASSHDQTQLVEVGYNQMSFHLGTVAIGAGCTITILLILFCCYCAGKKIMGHARTLSQLSSGHGIPRRPHPEQRHYPDSDWN